MVVMMMIKMNYDYNNFVSYIGLVVLDYFTLFFTINVAVRRK